MVAAVVTPTRLNYTAGGRRAYLEANAWGLWIALAGVFTAVSFFLDPDSLANSSVGQTIHPFDFLWNVMYGVGSLLIAVGLVCVWPRIEVAGLSLFAGATAINALAIVYVHGGASLSAAPLLVAAGIAAVFRIRYVVQITTRASR